MELVATRITGAARDTLARQIDQFVGEDKRRRARRCRDFMESLRILTADALLRGILAERLATSPRTLGFARNAYGKPYVVGTSAIHFNVSHSCEWVVVAVAESEVGVDVQYMGDVDLAPLTRQLHSHEQVRLARLEGAAKQQCFYAIWTAKEGYVKAVGRGLAESFSRFWVQEKPDRTIGIWTDAGCNDRWGCAQQPFADGYVLTVCTRVGESLEARVRWILVDQLAPWLAGLEAAHGKVGAQR